MHVKCLQYFTSLFLDKQIWLISLGRSGRFLFFCSRFSGKVQSLRLEWLTLDTEHHPRCFRVIMMAAASKPPVSVRSSASSSLDDTWAPHHRHRHPSSSGRHYCIQPTEGNQKKNQFSRGSPRRRQEWEEGVSRLQSCGRWDKRPKTSTTRTKNIILASTVERRRRRQRQLLSARSSVGVPGRCKFSNRKKEFFSLSPSVSSSRVPLFGGWISSRTREKRAKLHRPSTFLSASSPFNPGCNVTSRLPLRCSTLEPRSTPTSTSRLKT